jgi:hypothetical protein
MHIQQFQQTGTGVRIEEPLGMYQKSGDGMSDPGAGLRVMPARGGETGTKSVVGVIQAYRTRASSATYMYVPEEHAPGMSGSILGARWTICRAWGPAHGVYIAGRVVSDKLLPTGCDCYRNYLCWLRETSIARQGTH